MTICRSRGRAGGSRPAPPRPAPKPASRTGPQAPRSGRPWPPRQARRGRTRPRGRGPRARPRRAGLAVRPPATGGGDAPGALRMVPPAGDGRRGRRRRLRKATAKAAVDGRPPRLRAEAVVHRPADGHHTGKQRRASAVAGPHAAAGAQSRAGGRPAGGGTPPDPASRAREGGRRARASAGRARWTPRAGGG